MKKINSKKKAMVIVMIIILLAVIGGLIRVIYTLMNQDEETKTPEVQEPETTEEKE